jgi:hypothetical protein
MSVLLTPWFDHWRSYAVTYVSGFHIMYRRFFEKPLGGGGLEIPLVMSPSAIVTQSPHNLPRGIDKPASDFLMGGDDRSLGG